MTKRRARHRELELASLSRERAAVRAFTILDAIQDEPLEYLAVSLALVLKALTEEKHIAPQDLMTTASNMLKAEGAAGDNYIKALKAFVRDEVPD